MERLDKHSALSAIIGPVESLYPSYLKSAYKEISTEAQFIVDELAKLRIETPLGYRETAGQFVEPIQLQLVCQRWWRSRHEVKVHGETISQDTLEDQIDLRDLINVDDALEEFYLGAVRKASDESGIYDGDIRIWSEAKLITWPVQTRNFVHRGLSSSEGIPNKVLDSLESSYLIRGEVRSGAKWYELTHDRLIKPLINSNIKWKTNLQKTLREKKKSQSFRILLFAGIAAFAMGLFIGVSFGMSSFSDDHIINEIPMGEDVELFGIAINPITNMTYVAGYDDSNDIGKVIGISNRYF